MKDDFNQEMKWYLIAMNWKDEEISEMKKSIDTAKAIISENKYSG